MSMIAISYSCDSTKTEAQQLSKSLRLPLAPLETKDYPLKLVVTPERTELRFYGSEPFNPVFVDFLKGKLAHRHQYGGGRGQLIARAVGLKNNPHPTVLDLTAGLGSDAFVLASLGCKVTMVERSPIIATLLRDGLARANQQPWFKALNLKLIESEAQAYLTPLTQLPDVIYLDPMFPETKKSALVKKEMRLLRLLVGKDEDAGDLLTLALTKARKRVVVKRALHASLLTNTPPSLVYKGKSSRFDVYTQCLA